MLAGFHAVLITSFIFIAANLKNIHSGIVGTLVLWICWNRVLSLPDIFLIFFISNRSMMELNARIGMRPI